MTKDEFIKEILSREERLATIRDKIYEQDDSAEDYASEILYLRGEQGACAAAYAEQLLRADIEEEIVEYHESLTPFLQCIADSALQTTKEHDFKMTFGEVFLFHMLLDQYGLPIVGDDRFIPLIERSKSRIDSVKDP